jgi:hypothetical protein
MIAITFVWSWRSTGMYAMASGAAIASVIEVAAWLRASRTDCATSLATDHSGFSGVTALSGLAIAVVM